MFQVHYFQNTRQYFEQLDVKSDELHLIQSASLVQFLKKTKNSEQFLGYKMLSKKLFPKWNHSHTDLYLLSKIRQYIRKNTESHQSRIYETGIQEILESFRYVMELRMTDLNALENATQKQQFFAGLVSDLKRDTLVRECLSELLTFSKAVVSMRLGVQPLNRLYVHHFDYIDGPRMTLFQLLRSIGIEVIFCIPFQEERKELYSTWDKIYRCIQEPSEWGSLGGIEEKNGMGFAGYLDKSIPAQSAQDSLNLQLMEFSDAPSFKKYLDEKGSSDRHAVLAMFDEDLNMYTGQTEVTHFYATNYGKFLMALSACRKTPQGIQLSYTNYVNMMISGWITAGHIKGEDALSLLIDLRSYLEDITSFQGLFERLHALTEFQEVSDAFDETAKLQTERNRIKKYMSNPFRSFSFTHRDRYNMTVKQLIECSKDLARKVNRLLLGEQETRSVKGYLEDLQKIYESVKEDWELKPVEMIEKLFSDNLMTEMVLGKEEMSAFLALSLGKQKNNEEEIKHEGKILNFDQLIGIALSHQDVHVTGLSLQTFPWKKPEMPRFITHTWLKECINRSFISANRITRLSALKVDYFSREYSRHKALYSLYHLLAYCSGNVTLSYIENLQEKDAPSIYLSVLEEIYNVQKENYVEKDLLFELEEDASPISEEELNLDPLSQIPDLIWLDKDFCYKKFLLTAMVEQFPVYEQDFHQQLVFSTVGKLLSEQGEGMKEVKETVFPLFPHWTNTMKQNLIDTNYTIGLRDYKSYENVYYPKAIRNLQTLRSAYEVTGRYKVKNQYLADTFNPNEHVKELKQELSEKGVKAEPGNHCRMCPYLHVCVEGEYAIDSRDN